MKSSVPLKFIFENPHWLGDFNTSQLTPEGRERLASACDAGEELFVLNVDDCSAATAGELVVRVRLRPTERFLNLVGDGGVAARSCLPHAE